MKVILLTLLLFGTVNANEYRPGQPIDENAYNVHMFTGQATALEPYYESFEFRGKATRIHNAWRQTQAMLNEMATKGYIPDGAAFRIVINWRGANFVRIMIAHQIIE
jgi:hypothetical protein